MPRQRIALSALVVTSTARKIGVVGLIAAGLLPMACGGDEEPPNGASAKADAPAPAMSVVAIGDSIPYGQQDCGYCDGFPALYGKSLEREAGARVTVDNLSLHTGIDSTGLRRTLAEDDFLMEAVAAADAVTVSIGHNDPPWNRPDDPCDGRALYPKAEWERYDAACVEAVSDEYGRNLAAILQRVGDAGDAEVLVTNDYNDIIGDPAVPERFYPVARRVVDALSRRTCEVARDHGAVCVDTHSAFNGPDGTRDAAELLAGDHTHPNAKGHRVIADLLMAAD